MISHYLCPLCKLPLYQGGASYSCNNNHQFDIAKEGYVNLLPVQNKKSKQPGDNQEMVAARRAFFETDHYHFLRDRLAQIVSEKAPATLLDLGCGEGFYTHEIANRCENAKVYGVDIAKPAVRYAAKRYPQVEFSVASIKEAPFENEFADVIVSIFAPVFAEELARLCKPSGSLYVVSPGEHHLFELKSLIYDNVKLHKAPETPQGFELVERTKLQQTHRMEFECVEHLIMMTPFAWKFKQQHIDRLQKMDHIEITLSFLINQYQRK
ncbi:23S rRNA (guanine(745)-N(1))-methyltransferase [Pseudoalteromonas sp. HM-SA03]|uniref:23S rRNA (guanine(745)-N(1))-methyltransferase n=1 Tax=Pseudoalteromonas sp. HM-SA03 TaxID=2029678 RepID=UPI000BAE34E3|nr:23S rRNA (guanine(745)-N(1))-methyltransferase [Pseudoalteromonas sp. HM-SA03]PAY00982.1 23S rRNA (guanine(745)-N(1))-methyltransferase [Pseudoalteromonas sp. HM-SA03]